MPYSTVARNASGTPFPNGAGKRCVPALTAWPMPSPPRSWLNTVVPAPVESRTRTRVPLSCKPPVTQPCMLAGHVSGAQATL